MLYHEPNTSKKMRLMISDENMNIFISKKIENDKTYSIKKLEKICRLF